MTDDPQNPEKIPLNPIVQETTPVGSFPAATPATQDEKVGREVYNAYAKIPDSQVPSKFKPLLYLWMFIIMMIIFVVGYLIFKDYLPSLVP